MVSLCFVNHWFRRKPFWLANSRNGLRLCEIALFRVEKSRIRWKVTQILYLGISYTLGMFTRKRFHIAISKTCLKQKIFFHVETVKCLEFNLRFASTLNLKKKKINLGCPKTATSYTTDVYCDIHVNLLSKD